MGKATSLLSVAAVALTMLSTASATLDPIVIKGSKFFFKSNGTQFFIKGVAYQAGISSNGTTTSSDTYTDPLSDEATCTRDIPYLKKLGANTIRTYALDPTADHSACLSLLDDAGIYVISDLGEPSLSINRADPQWTTDLYKRYTAVIDSVANYTNIIGFFAGNEVPNNTTYTGSAAFVKAAVRDSKAYIKAQGYRAMGVGYAADDDADVRADVAAYFNCGDTADQIDFWGYNIYEWCGDSSYTLSGYDQRVKEFETYSVPTFFAEYGCNTQGGGAAGRKFTEVKALYGSDMTPVFSGGIVYEYFQEDNDYGLVSVIDSSSVSTLSDFGAFSSQIHAATPTGVNSASYTPTNTASSSCPTVDSTWLAAEELPPTPNESLCTCMVSSLSCTVADDITDDDISTLFAQVCGYNSGKPCAGVSRNTTTGTYGAYSMCEAKQQLSNAFNAYYVEQGSASTACDFGGKAQVVSAKAASSCSSILSSASATASTGSSASASASKSSSDAGISLVGASLGLGRVWGVGFAILVGASGVGMVLL